MRDTVYDAVAAGGETVLRSSGAAAAVVRPPAAASGGVTDDLGLLVAACTSICRDIPSSATPVESGAPATKPVKGFGAGASTGRSGSRGTTSGKSLKSAATAAGQTPAPAVARPGAGEATKKYLVRGWLAAAGVNSTNPTATYQCPVPQPVTSLCVSTQTDARGGNPQLSVWAATPAGSVMEMRWPFSMAASNTICQTLYLHSGGISAMKMSKDGAFLLTASADGSIGVTGISHVITECAGRRVGDDPSRSRPPTAGSLNGGTALIGKARRQLQLAAVTEPVHDLVRALIISLTITTLDHMSTTR